MVKSLYMLLQAEARCCHRNGVHVLSSGVPSQPYSPGPCEPAVWLMPVNIAVQRLKRNLMRKQPAVISRFSSTGLY